MNSAAVGAAATIAPGAYTAATAIAATATLTKWLTSESKEIETVGKYLSSGSYEIVVIRVRLYNRRNC